MTVDSNKLFINGDWISAGGTFPIHDPATGEIVGYAADAEQSHALLAVEAAHTAFPTWSKTPAPKRSALLYRWYELIMEHRDEIATLLTCEMGKPFPEAKGEVSFAANFVLWYAEEAKRIYGDTVPSNEPNKRITVLRQPVGVVSAITPWNFPAAMVTRKVAPALAAGCTVILKPAEQTPLTAIRLVELAEVAGFPAGVFNLVTTSKPAEVGNVLTTDPRVRKVTFTGSTEVGKLLYRQAADTIKRVSLELGGHAPFIVFADAEIDLAVQGVIASKYRNAGQTCICTNRVYVHESIAASFAEKLRQAVSTLQVGPGMKEGVHIGPLIDEHALAKVERHVEDALAKGATLLIGGSREGEQGYFFQATVLNHATEDMQIATEETFGPVAPIFTFQSEEEVLARANDTPYGLAAYFYTRDIGRVTRMQENLEYGIIGVNDPAPSVAIQAPFGGVKESGLAREGGKYGLDAFLETKYISLAFA
ncbi:succinate-semialdehyde dehydrogenase (NADP(+)) [Tumebacillus algifaecis]|uniref:Succinate-semialdehyde dehydrogenase (NADP(+)) n=1 Tax=Tumebacillus algifaecis TaxID=1214604 RepID=A0A223CYM0_9BACL|nr:NAD-dependent succinate-semialdehyde dehydrogenase [Tumebacillus algifaecis]ASS74421.1 succinate-semialdehyde dehydrogenase (NADP(+)) [Tumebacillus algifaecis]